MQLVALGQGISISTALATGSDPRIEARPLPGAFPPRPYGLAIRRGRTPTTAARAFIDALRGAAARLERWPDA